MEQLPLLATLKGNDFLNFKDLIHFHRNLMQVQNGKILHLSNKVFPKLADFIRRQGVDMDLKQFARKILRDESKASIMQVQYCSFFFKKNKNNFLKHNFINTFLKVAKSHKVFFWRPIFKINARNNCPATFTF